MIRKAYSSMRTSTLPPFDLLGRHVKRRTDERAGASQLNRLTLDAQGFGSPEVDPLDERRLFAPLDEKQVVGLSIAVTIPPREKWPRNRHTHHR
jgi:hypothetical protein